MDALRRGAVSLVVVLSACGAQHAPSGAADAGANATVGANAAAGASAPVATNRVVDAARLTAADGDAANWLTYGRTYDEQRFSPLKQINAQSVGQLKLAWHYDLDAATKH
jgi:glucose dehydrogenase